MTERDTWLADLLRGPWRVVARGAGKDLIELRVEGGTPAKPLVVCSVAILIGDARIDAVGRALAEAISQVPGLLRDRDRLDCLLRESQPDALLEEAIIALRGVQNDREIAKGTGTPAVVSEWTWEKARLVLRRAGVACED